MASTWKQRLFTEDDFLQLRDLTSDSSEDGIINSPVRPDEESFEEFMEKGISTLVNDHASFVKKLI